MKSETLKTIKILGILGVIASVLVGIGEHLLHYSPHVLDGAKEYAFFKYVPLQNLSKGHLFAMVGLPLYFAGYLHVYLMLKSGNKLLAKTVLAFGFIAFAVGGVWIGSRASIGNIVHLKDSISPPIYQNLIDNYTANMEVLVKALRIIIAGLSVFFIAAILKGGTQYKKWMVFFNPILILLVVFSSMFWAPPLAKHLAPIAMNVTHFILFSVSLFQLKTLTKNN